MEFVFGFSKREAATFRWRLCVLYESVSGARHANSVNRSIARRTENVWAKAKRKTNMLLLLMFTVTATRCAMMMRRGNVWLCCVGNGMFTSNSGCGGRREVFLDITYLQTDSAVDFQQNTKGTKIPFNRDKIKSESLFTFCSNRILLHDADLDYLEYVFHCIIHM